jgi:hypothetical protein
MAANRVMANDVQNNTFAGAQKGQLGEIFLYFS